MKAIIIVVVVVDFIFILENKLSLDDDDQRLGEQITGYVWCSFYTKDYSGTIVSFTNKTPN